MLVLKLGTFPTLPVDCSGPPSAVTQCVRSVKKNIFFLGGMRSSVISLVASDLCIIPFWVHFISTSDLHWQETLTKRAPGLLRWHDALVHNVYRI